MGAYWGHSQGAAPSSVKRDQSLVETVWNPPFQARSAETDVVGKKASLTVQGRNGDPVNQRPGIRCTKSSLYAKRKTDEQIKTAAGSD